MSRYHFYADEEYQLPGDRDCPECGGEGFVEDECFADTCCCADPTTHGIRLCSVCGLKSADDKTNVPST